MVWTVELADTNVFVFAGLPEANVKSMVATIFAVILLASVIVNLRDVVLTAVILSAGTVWPIVYGDVPAAVTITW